MKSGIFGACQIAALALSLVSVRSAGAEEGADKQARVSLDIDYTVALGEGDTDHGAGGALRLGYLLNLVATSVTPEIGLDYHGFDGTLSPSIYRAFVGCRTSFGGLLAPGLYGRFGIAHENDDVQSRTVPTIGAGLTLDLSPIPVLDIGLHTGYENLFGSDDANAFDWWTFGVHAGAAF